MSDHSITSLIEKLRRKILSRIEFDTNGGCWLWTGLISQEGYGRVCKGRKSYLAHRESYRTFVGCPDGMLVCHKCDVRSCVNPAHLWLGTNDENMADMAAKGRAKPSRVHGMAHPHAKLTDDDVLAIRQSSTSDGKLAEIYGVANETIRKARSGKSWKHLNLKAA